MAFCSPYKKAARGLREKQSISAPTSGASVLCCTNFSLADG